MPFISDIDRREYARNYYRKNAERINERRAEREEWKRIAELDDFRARAVAALDEVMAPLSDSDVRVLYSVVSRCTPRMLEELVARSKASPD